MSEFSISKLLKLLLVGSIILFFPITQIQSQTENIWFEEVTEQVGMIHTGQTFGSSWGDFNGDGLPDLWVSNHYVKPSLYINQGNGIFVNKISEIVSIDNSKADTHGAAWADFDNDGDQDLIQLVGGESGKGQGSNLLYVNNDRRLEDQAAIQGLDYPFGRGRTPLWFDYNNDGMIDILLANIKRPDGQAPSTLFEQNNSGLFQNVSEIFGNTVFSQLSDISGDGKLDLITSSNVQQYPVGFYDIGNSFQDLSITTGLLSKKTNNVVDTAFVDFDNDLDIDIYMTRTKSSSEVKQINDNQINCFIRSEDREIGFSFNTDNAVSFNLYQIEKEQIFIGADSHHPQITSCKGSCSFTLSPGDNNITGIQNHVISNDKYTHISYDAIKQVWKIVFSVPKGGKTKCLINSVTPISGLKLIGLEPLDDIIYQDKLLMNDNGNLKDQTIMAGLNIPNQCKSVAAADFNNDMYVDIYLVCSDMTKNIANVLYENQGNGTFISIPKASGAEGSIFGTGDSVSVADYDQDGFLDIFVTNGYNSPFNQGPHQLFRNLGNDSHWLEIDLVGTISNRDGIGASIVATTKEISQLREQNGGMHRYSQNHKRIHFGLSDNEIVDNLVIRWPSGIVQELNNVVADQILQVVEPSLYLAFDGLQSSYKIGDRFIFELIQKLKREQFEKEVDLWMAIQMPNGDLWFKTGTPTTPFSSQAQLFKSSIKKLNMSEILLDFAIPPDILEGYYVFYAAYVIKGEDPVVNSNAILSIIGEKITLTN